jgi:hypothetical protein
MSGFQSSNCCRDDAHRVSPNKLLLKPVSELKSEKIAVEKPELLRTVLIIESWTSEPVHPKR